MSETIETSLGEKKRSTRDECLDLIRERENSDRPWPHAMPMYAQDAVEWFLSLIEPPDPFTDRPRWIATHNGGGFWQEPYVDRVIACLKRYLNADEGLQRTIVAAREDDIPWRGDDERVFRLVIEETERMREMGRDAYREAGRRKFRALVESY